MVRIDLMGGRSGSCKNMGTGKRPTHKIGCPTRIKLACRKHDGCKWFIDPRVELHNHDFNLGNMEPIASYRRWRAPHPGQQHLGRDAQGAVHVQEERGCPGPEKSSTSATADVP
jgi:hypothetical protein